MSLCPFYIFSSGGHFVKQKGAIKKTRLFKYIENFTTKKMKIFR